MVELKLVGESISTVDGSAVIEEMTTYETFSTVVVDALSTELSLAYTRTVTAPATVGVHARLEVLRLEHPLGRPVYVYVRFARAPVMFTKNDVVELTVTVGGLATNEAMAYRFTVSLTVALVLFPAVSFTNTRTVNEPTLVAVHGR